MAKYKYLVQLGSLMTGAILMCMASPAQAVVIFDNIDSTTTAGRDAGDAPGVLISVASTVTINQIAVNVNLDADANLKFLIFDHATHTLLYQSAPKFFADDGFGLKTSDPFSFTLLAGSSYDIGAIADVDGDWGFDIIANSQNGITSIVQNPNFGNFAIPQHNGHAMADGHIQLIVSESTTVPESGTLSLMIIGLVGIGFTRLKRRA